MFERLKSLYERKAIDESAILQAVTRGWITQEQADEILTS